MTSGGVPLPQHHSLVGLGRRRRRVTHPARRPGGLRRAQIDAVDAVVHDGAFITAVERAYPAHHNRLPCLSALYTVNKTDEAQQPTITRSIRMVLCDI